MAKKRQSYDGWLKTRSHAEYELQSMALTYEEKYFSDLRLTEPSIHKKLLVYQVQCDDGTWIDTSDDLNITVDDWIFKYRRSPNWLGFCDDKHRTIYIRTGLDETKHKAALLHEMIHAYEAMLSQPYREWLLLELHKRMLRRVSPAKLHRYIAASTHTIVHNNAHGILFLLKSLELDLRFRWKLGTVFGYNRQDYFHN
jgi:hypothetical protein